MSIGCTAVGLLLIRTAAAADIAAYVTCTGAASPYAAMRVATGIFKRIGIALEWRSPKDVKDGARIPLHIEIALETAQDRAPGALAISYPFNCTKRITVFYDRIRMSNGHVSRESALFGYVLVHEITHVLQGTDTHADQGIMKAHWDDADRTAIYRGKLSFSGDDIRQIRHGLTAEWRQSCPLISAPSESGIAAHPE